MLLRRRRQSKPSTKTTVRRLTLVGAQKRCVFIFERFERLYACVDVVLCESTQCSSRRNDRRDEVSRISYLCTAGSGKFEGMRRISEWRSVEELHALSIKFDPYVYWPPQPIDIVIITPRNGALGQVSFNFFFLLRIRHARIILCALCEHGLDSGY